MYQNKALTVADTTTAMNGVQAQPYQTPRLRFNTYAFANDYRTWDDIVTEATFNACKLCMKAYGGMRSRGPIGRTVSVKKNGFVYLYQVHEDKHAWPVAFTTETIDNDLTQYYLKAQETADALLVADDALSPGQSN